MVVIRNFQKYSKNKGLKLQFLPSYMAYYVNFRKILKYLNEIYELNFSNFIKGTSY